MGSRELSAIAGRSFGKPTKEVDDWEAASSVSSAFLRRFSPIVRGRVKKIPRIAAALAIGTSISLASTVIGLVLFFNHMKVLAGVVFWPALLLWPFAPCSVNGVERGDPSCEQVASVGFAVLCIAFAILVYGVLSYVILSRTRTREL
jgi:hypothetical protein